MQLDKERKAWCEGVVDIGSSVSWGGKDDNKALKSVALVDRGKELEHGFVAVVHGEEQRIDAGKEEDFVLNFYTDIYFVSLVWPLAWKEPEQFEEDMEQR